MLIFQFVYLLQKEMTEHQFVLCHLLFLFLTRKIDNFKLINNSLLIIYYHEQHAHQRFG